MSKAEQFIIAGQPALLGPLLEILKTDPEVAVLYTATNRSGAPTRLVVSMDPHRARALGVALGGRLIVEPDQHLPEPGEVQPP
jgi:hypothetical protein